MHARVSEKFSGGMSEGYLNVCEVGGGSICSVILLGKLLELQIFKADLWRGGVKTCSHADMINMVILRLQCELLHISLLQNLHI